METFIEDDEESVITLNMIIHACRKHILEKDDQDLS
jgi:hypothetical protein